MRYPVIIHKEPASEYGIILPDFPGVFSGGESLDAALGNIQDAIETFYEGEENPDIPEPSSLEAVLDCEDARDGVVALAEIHLDFLDKKAVPVNITLPRYIKNRIDKAAKTQGLSRSAYLIKAALAYGS